MEATGEDFSDVTLVTQCMAFCQTLIRQDIAFNFSIKTDSVCFTMDTKEKSVSCPVKDCVLKGGTPKI